MATGRREHYIEWSEDTEVSWIEMLVEFEEKVLPVFERAGYSKDTALILWSIVQLKQSVNDIADAVIPDDEEQDQT